MSLNESQFTSAVAGQQYEYGFDDIGNRTSAKAGGDATRADLTTIEGFVHFGARL